MIFLTDLTKTKIMNRSENIELLIMVSTSLDEKKTIFKMKLYNFILLSLKLFEIDCNYHEDPYELARIIINKVRINQDVPEYYTTTKLRFRELVQARQIAMVFINRNTRISQVKIGRILFGGKDHATINHACKTFDNLMDTDIKFRYNIKYLARELQIKY